MAGITASPGDSIAGTTSPAPFGPGTERTPDAYPCGAPCGAITRLPPLAFVVIVNAFAAAAGAAAAANLFCAIIAWLYAAIRF